jgi:NodT family efflux transporter outer membrane factor (OMF) lipoprotein
MAEVRPLAVSAWAAALFACASPTPVTTPFEVPAAFSQPGTAPAAERWWQDLADPRVDALIEESLAGNLGLQAAWDRLAQAQAIARREGALLFPTLDGNADAQAAWGNGSSRGFESGGGRRDEFGVGLVAAWEIDLFGRLRAARDAARLDVAASGEDLRAIALALSARVATTWYELVEQRGQLLLLDEQIATNARVEELVTLRFRTGQVSAADVLRQRQLVEERRGERLLAEARAQVLSHQLAVLLGRPPASLDLDAAAVLPALPALPATGLPADLLGRRPDVRRAYQQVLASDRRLASARADRWPRLALSASGGLSSDELRDLVDDWIATIAAQLVAPLFDAGRRSAEVKRTRAVVSERLHGYGDVVLIALQEVEDALVRERQQRAFIESLDLQLELAQEALLRIRDRYIKGAVLYLDVLAALQSQQALSRNRLTAARELVAVRIALHRALSGGFALPAPPQT